MGNISRFSSSTSDNPLIHANKLPTAYETTKRRGGDTERRRICPRRTTLFTWSLITVLSVALIIMIATYLRLNEQTKPLVALKCGNRIEEAEAAGCTFDLLSKTWLPGNCTRYGTEEYIHAAADINQTRWQYWEDGERARELDDQQLSLLSQRNETNERQLWASTDREYLTHCAWMIIRLAHAQMTGDRVDTATTNFDQTKQCALAMLQKAMSAPNLDAIFTRGGISLGSC
jgi:hypothetical protein